MEFVIKRGLSNQWQIASHTKSDIGQVTNRWLVVSTTPPQHGQSNEAEELNTPLIRKFSLVGTLFRIAFHKYAKTFNGIAFNQIFAHRNTNSSTDNYAKAMILCISLVLNSLSEDSIHLHESIESEQGVLLHMRNHRSKNLSYWTKLKNLSHLKNQIFSDSAKNSRTHSLFCDDRLNKLGNRLFKLIESSNHGSC